MRVEVPSCWGSGFAIGRRVYLGCLESRDRVPRAPLPSASLWLLYLPVCWLPTTSALRQIVPPVDPLTQFGRACAILAPSGSYMRYDNLATRRRQVLATTSYFFADASREFAPVMPWELELSDNNPGPRLDHGHRGK